MKLIPTGATRNFKIHLVVATLINLTLIYRLVNIVWNGNDKEIILLMLGYPFLILLNSIIWGIFGYYKRTESSIYKLMTVMLALLFIPAIIVSSLY